MAPLHYCLVFLLLSCLLSFSSASHPHALLLPVKKDPSTLQYVTSISQRTPLNLVVDLGSRFLWLDCDSPSTSSRTRHPVLCHAPQCSLIQTPFGCSDNTSTCSVLLDNPYSFGTTGTLSTDATAFRSTNGYNPGPIVRAADFIFTCASTSLLKGLARGASGMAGLGRNRIGLPVQLAVAFRLRPVFALCVGSSGVIFIGDGPYHFLLNVEASQGLIYTPLLVNRVSTAGAYVKGEKSVEYFIGVTAIKINNKVVPVNTTLLTIDKHGNGGTKISTVTPYMTLETSIYKAVTRAFAASLSGVKRAAPVGKFSVCYNYKDLGSTRVGVAVPQIDLVLQSESVYWRMFGANSMVEAKAGVYCLAFVDGGVSPNTAIVIGGHQIEDNLLHFDLKRGRLGFTSSLLFRQTTCANFNFTAKP